MAQFYKLLISCALLGLVSCAAAARSVGGGSATPAVGAAAPAPTAACTAEDIAAAALAPPDGLPSDWIGKLSPRLLFFQVLADFSYENDFLTRSPRASTEPCLKAWGAAKSQRVSATSALGADVHALVVATAANDVIVSFRGMDTLRDLEFEDTVIAPDYNATYFGPAAAAFAAKAKAKAKAQKGVSGVSGGGGGQQRPQQAVADPDEFWILKGYAEAYEAIEAPVRELVTKWGVPATAKLWLTGHSDGSQLAQIAALRAAAKFGADAVAGVVLFGPSRVGSRAFADYYASTGLGARTTYYSYGRDPAANGDYTVAQGLEFPGTGLYACPFSEAATERLVVVPPGADRDGVCTELKAVSSWLSRLAPPDVLPGVDTSDPALDSVSSYEYLAQHIPSVTYDGLMRLLLASPALAAPSKCELAALGLASCVVSNKCSAALRPASAVKCRGCGSDATCSSYWGMGAGARCDRANSELSSWLCYGGGGGAAPVPPTLAGLFWGKNGGSAAETMPQLRFVNPLANRRNPFVQNQQRVG